MFWLQTTLSAEENTWKSKKNVKKLAKILNEDDFQKFVEFAGAKGLNHDEKVMEISYHKLRASLTEHVNLPLQFASRQWLSSRGLSPLS